MSERMPEVGFTIKPNSDPDSQYTNRNFAVTEATLEELQDAIEKHGFDNQSEALRYFLTLGMNSFVETDPRNKKSRNGDEGYTPLTIREVLPDSKEDALDMREGEVLDEIDKRLAEEIAEDPKIAQEGWKVWTEE
jgi:Arc/MetJ-type ribon-helix-helix transcriptional regulator